MVPTLSSQASCLEQLDAGAPAQSEARETLDVCHQPPSLPQEEQFFPKALPQAKAGNMFICHVEAPFGACVAIWGRFGLMEFVGGAKFKAFVAHTLAAVIPRLLQRSLRG